MKKLLSLICAGLLAVSAAISVCASGESAFSNVMITADTKIVDVGGTSNPIAYMEAYGVGYSSKGDQVIFEDVDFGNNGANKMYINFSYGNESNSTNIAVFIDKRGDTPAATFNIGYTGGWESKFAKEFTAEINVPAGKHDIIVEFLDETGSFNYVRFDEAPAAPAEVDSAAQTSDASVAVAALRLASLAGALIVSKKIRRA